MKFDTSALRATSGVGIDVPWKARDVTMIWIRQDGRITQAGTVSDKRSALQEAAPEDCLLLAWPGRHRQDVFNIDDRDQATAAFE